MYTPPQPGVDEWARVKEAAHLAEIRIGRTASRSVLGSMNDFALHASWYIRAHGAGDLVALALDLAETPCSPLKYGRPRDMAVDLLHAA